MKYILKEYSRFVCGFTSFGLDLGAVVYVKQWDHNTRKVLIDFGGNCMDWFDTSILDKFTEVKE